MSYCCVSSLWEHCSDIAYNHRHTCTYTDTSRTLTQTRTHTKYYKLSWKTEDRKNSQMQAEPETSKQTDTNKRGKGRGKGRDRTFGRRIRIACQKKKVDKSDRIRWRKENYFVLEWIKMPSAPDRRQDQSWYLQRGQIIFVTCGYRVLIDLPQIWPRAGGSPLTSSRWVDTRLLCSSRAAPVALLFCSSCDRRHCSGDDGIFFKEAEWSQIFCQSWTGTPRWISLNVLFMSSSSTANQIKHNEIEFVASSRRCTLECNNLNLEYVTFKIQANLDVTVNPT